MSTSIVAAFAVLQARAEAEITTLPLFWQDVDNQLPDSPASFVYFELVTERGDFIEIGGGRGANRYRHSAELNAFVFFPRGTGLPAGLDLAEPVASAFRSFRASGVSCEGASVHPVGEGEALAPPGLRSPVGNYACVMVNIPLYFDQLG